MVVKLTQVLDLCNNIIKRLWYIYQTDRQACANTVDPDQMLQNTAFDQGQH